MPNGRLVDRNRSPGPPERDTYDAAPEYGAYLSRAIAIGNQGSGRGKENRNRSASNVILKIRLRLTVDVLSFLDALHSKWLARGRKGSKAKERHKHSCPARKVAKHRKSATAAGLRSYLAATRGQGRRREPSGHRHVWLVARPCHGGLFFRAVSLSVVPGAALWSGPLAKNRAVAD